MEINRKRFLQYSAALFSTFYFRKVSSEPETSENTTHKKSVIIIGAGLSGLYAAYLLQNSGYSVKVLEAKNRIGGRIFTYYDTVSSIRSELGGEFVYGYQKNILKLCESFSIELAELNIQTSMFLNGKYIPFNEVKENEKTQKILMKIGEMYTKMAVEQKEGLDKLSAANYLNYQGVEKKELFLLELRYSLYYGESLRHISANQFIQLLVNINQPESKTYKMIKGNDSLLKALVSSIGKSKIKINQPVVSISQDKKAVSVKIKNGKEYKADICICTIPASVMNQIHWSPDLSKGKKIANLQVKYGRITKIISQFKNIDWINKNWHILTDRLLQYVFTAGINLRPILTISPGWTL
ncbi:MAG: FAD-dependent oxidoreductase, partial [Leptospiraceae bacterium]|nr:FAD-dependent oxidoreductase [Leptospiraceae bacterium]